jgi:hypothetical protein
VCTCHSKELFYQEALRRFSQVEGRITLKTPLPLLSLILEGLNQRRQKQQQQQRTRSKAPAAVDVTKAEAKDMVELLLSKGEMIDEYFAIRLSAHGSDAQATEAAAAGSEGMLCTLPVLVEQYEPYWCGTPISPFPSCSLPGLNFRIQTIALAAMRARYVGDPLLANLVVLCCRGALPDFLVSLAVDVDWTEEQVSLAQISKAIDAHLIL